VKTRVPAKGGVCDQVVRHKPLSVASQKKCIVVSFLRELILCGNWCGRNPK